MLKQVFGGSNQTVNSGNVLISLDRFNDLTTFTQITSRLMVSEIRRRASNKTTEDASQAIVNFLEIPREEPTSPTIPDIGAIEIQSTTLSPSSSSESFSSSNNNNSNQKGWILLSTLNLLVCNGSSALIPIMASSSLPSTLVKCLYLFFDLPATSEGKSLVESPDQTDTTNQDAIRDAAGSSRLNSKERRLLIQRVFAQLLTRLCAHPSSLHELTRKDDLALLFNAITSWCPKHNQIWRQTAADVVVMMARSQVTNCAYIHEKNCISICVENMSRSIELGTISTGEITDMITSLINFLFEVTVNSPSTAGVLLDDFKTALGYHLLVDFSLKLEAILPEDEDNLVRIIGIITKFTRVGTSELKPRPLSVNQLFIMDDFSMPRPSTKEAIRNLSAFNVLQTLWLKAKTVTLQDLLLSSLLSIYREDHANYFILDSQNTLSQFAEKLQLKPVEIQVSASFLIVLVLKPVNIFVGETVHNHGVYSFRAEIRTFQRIDQY